MSMERKSYMRPECQVFFIEYDAPLLGQSQFDYVDGDGFIQVVTGEGVKPEQGL